MTPNHQPEDPGGDRPRAPAAPELGDEELDRQHRVLLQRWAGVARAAAAEDLRQLGAMLWFIEQYTQEHFASEERRMAESAYPEAERHVRRHRQFAARLGRLRQDVVAGRHLLSSADYAWVIDWFERHIRDEDLRLKRHLDGRRLSTGTGGR
jgi:hemerythrin